MAKRKQKDISKRSIVIEINAETGEYLEHTAKGKADFYRYSGKEAVKQLQSILKTEKNNIQYVLLVFSGAALQFIPGSKNWSKLAQSLKNGTILELYKKT